MVGDSLNPRKPAFRIAARLEEQGRLVHRVNPRDKTGECFASLSDIPPGSVDLVNLVISPLLGVGIVEEMRTLGLKYLFIQPGADSPKVLAAAEAAGLTVQQGCVLRDDLPPLASK